MAESVLARLLVDEYRGRKIIEWDSLTQCARAHRVSVSTIKYLIHTGGTIDGRSTFDLPVSSRYDTRKTGPTMRDVELYDTRTGMSVEQKRTPLRAWLQADNKLCDDERQEAYACQG
ncbi:MAG: hypothetical protein EOM15_12010 [Spirochaetia bacterium]|nr:hypothetical protein [Spirochaetia bacterium]